MVSRILVSIATVMNRRRAGHHGQPTHGNDTMGNPPMATTPWATHSWQRHHGHHSWQRRLTQKGMAVYHRPPSSQRTRWHSAHYAIEGIMASWLLTRSLTQALLGTRCCAYLRLVNDSRCWTYHCCSNLYEITHCAVAPIILCCHYLVHHLASSHPIFGLVSPDIWPRLTRYLMPNMYLARHYDMRLGNNHSRVI